MKNLLKHILFVCASLTASLSGMASAPVEGYWSYIPVSRPMAVTEIAESAPYVYYISGGTLHRYDRAAQKATLLNRQSGLNHDYTRQLVYNPDKKYLIAVMADGLMNIIYDDGRIIQVNDLVKGNTYGAPEIRGVAYNGNDIVASTTFGVCVVDATTGRVKAIGNYPYSSTANTISGGPAVIGVAGDDAYAIWGQQMFSAPIATAADLQKLKSASAWKAFDKTIDAAYAPEGIYSFGPRNFVLTLSKYAIQNSLWPTTVSANYSTYSIPASTAYPAQEKQRIFRGGENTYAVRSTNGLGNAPTSLYQITGTDTEKPANHKLIAQILSQKTQRLTAISASSYSDIIWIANDKGFAGYKAGTDGSLTQVVSPEKLTVAGASPVSNASMMVPSADGETLYFGTRSGSNTYLKNAGHYFNPDLQDKYRGFLLINPTIGFPDGALINANNIYKVEPAFFVPSYFGSVSTDGKVEDRSVYTALVRNGTTNPENAWPYGIYTYRLLGLSPILASEGITENPKKPGELWIATMMEGLYKLTPDGKQEILSPDNGRLSAGGWGAGMQDAKFDDEGNLWIVAITAWNVTGKAGTHKKSFKMLPAAKVNGPVTDIALADWIEPATVPASSADWMVKNCATLFMTRNNPSGKYFAVIPQRGVAQMFIYKRNSQGADTSKDTSWVISNVKDQNGKVYSTMYTNAMYGDNEGRLWIQSPEFFGYIYDFNKLKAGDKIAPLTSVSLTDNANGQLAKKMQEAEVVAMSQAPDKTLWVATQNSGLFQLSKDGNKVLAHYNTKNSPLPSDVLGSVSVLKDGKVYVGSRYGVYVLTPGKEAAAANLDDVRVEPAPVPANYDGWFTISNLTLDAQVKIADGPSLTSAKVIYTGAANGGVLKWNGLDKDNHRIGAGVYYVFVNNGAAPVAKFIIID